MMNRLMVFAAAVSLFCTAALAQQYKWVDSNGRVQYGDTPPPGAKATRLRPPPPGSAPAAPAAAAPAAAGKKDDGKKPLTPEEAFQKRQKDAAEAEQKAQKAAAEAETKRSNCEAAQSQVRGLQSGERMATTNAAGERVYMEDTQRAAELARAQKAAADWCK